SVVVVAAINAYLMALMSLWNWCFTGTGHAARVVRPMFVAAAINLTASVLYTWRLGWVAGPLLGTCTALVLVDMWYLPMMLRLAFGPALRSLGRSVAGPLALGVACTGALWWVAHAHRPANLVMVLAEMGLAALAILGLGYALLLSPADRAAWRARLAMAIPRRRAAGPLDGTFPTSP